jgi:hypothetical protein
MPSTLNLQGYHLHAHGLRPFAWRPGTQFCAQPRDSCTSLCLTCRTFAAHDASVTVAALRMQFTPRRALPPSAAPPVLSPRGPNFPLPSSELLVATVTLSTAHHRMTTPTGLLTYRATAADEAVHGVAVAFHECGRRGGRRRGDRDGIHVAG